MTRTARLLTTGLVALSLAACGGSTAPSTAPSAAPASAKPAATAPAASTAAKPAASAASAKPAASASAKPAASGSAAAKPGASGAVDNTPVALGNNSTPDQAYLPILMALDTLKSQGYNVKDNVDFKSTQLGFQALQNNQIQLSSSGVTDPAAAVDKGLKIKVIDARANNAWSIVAKNSIATCDQLNGQKMGLFSTTGVSTAYVKIYLQTTCPKAQPNNVIIPDSVLRRQALEAGQIDASPLEGGDVIRIMQDKPGQFHVLADIAQTLPGIGRDVVVTNDAMLADHPTVVQAFVKAHLEAIRSIYKDPSTLTALDAKYLKLGDAASDIAKQYVSIKVWCANGGLAGNDVQKELDTFGEYKLIPTGLKAAQLTDTKALDAVLAQIGKSDATAC